MYIVPHHFECLILFPDHSFYFFSPSFSLFFCLIVCQWPQRQIQQMFPGPLEWLFCDFLAAVGTFHALCTKEHHEKTFLSSNDGWKIKFWCCGACSQYVCTLSEKISNLQALSDWQLMALRQTFKDLSVSAAFLYVCVCLSSPVGHVSDYDQSASVSLLEPCPRAPHPSPNKSTTLPFTRASSDQWQPRSGLLYVGGAAA